MPAPHRHQDPKVSPAEWGWDVAASRVRHNQGQVPWARRSPRRDVGRILAVAEHLPAQPARRDLSRARSIRPAPHQALAAVDQTTTGRRRRCLCQERLAPTFRRSARAACISLSTSSADKDVRDTDDSRSAASKRRRTRSVRSSSRSIASTISEDRSPDASASSAKPLGRDIVTSIKSAFVVMCGDSSHSNCTICQTSRQLALPHFVSNRV
jgi:hypothetical protein